MDTIISLGRRKGPEMGVLYLMSQALLCTFGWLSFRMSVKEQDIKLPKRE